MGGSILMEHERSGQNTYFTCFVPRDYLTILKIFLSPKHRIATRIFPAFLTIISCFSQARYCPHSVLSCPQSVLSARFCFGKQQQQQQNHSGLAEMSGRTARGRGTQGRGTPGRESTAKGRSGASVATVGREVIGGEEEEVFIRISDFGCEWRARWWRYWTWRWWGKRWWWCWT
jgi:hypothetical protein